MKLFIVFALFVATALAAPSSPDPDAVILKYDQDNIGAEGYNNAGDLHGQYIGPEGDSEGGFQPELPY